MTFIMMKKMTNYYPKGNKETKVSNLFHHLWYRPRDLEIGFVSEIECTAYPDYWLLMT